MNLVATMMQSSFSGQAGVMTAQNKGSTDFSKYLNQASSKSSAQKIMSTEYEKPDNILVHENNIDKYSSSKVDGQSETQRPSETLTDDKVSEVNPTNELRADTSKEVEGTDVPEDVAEVVEEAVEMVETEVLNAVAAELNMTQEELMVMLESLNMTVADLFNMENLKVLVMEQFELTEPIELLTTEGARESLQQLTEVITGVMETQHQAVGGEETMSYENFQSMVQELLTEHQTSGEGQSDQSGDTATEMQLTQNTTTDQAQQMSGFEGVLNQVVTQKTETFVMNGQVQTIYTEVTAKDVFDQIVTGMKVEVSEGTSKMMLQLEPEHLGKIALDLQTKNGVLTGQFIAETEAVKEIIEANLSQLKTQLANQGIEVSEIEITVGSSDSYFTGEDGNNFNGEQNKNSSKKRHLGNVNGVFADNISDDKMMVEDTVVMENSSIELQA